MTATESQQQSKAGVVSATLTLAVYLGFFVTFCSWWIWLVPSSYKLPTWLEQVLLPYRLDQAPVEESVMSAILQNLALLTSFCVPHSILARRSVKKWMGLPTALERPFFVLQATLFMAGQLAFWKNFETDSFVIWDYSQNPVVSAAILAAYGCGFLFLLTASFALDHFHLFGLTQGFGMDLNATLGLAPQKTANNQLAIRWHYSIVAHPIMTGFLVGLWAAPRMDGPRFLLASVYTLYIMIAVLRFEEKTLEQEIGPAYRKYLSTVPRFIPFSGGSTIRDAVKME